MSTSNVELSADLLAHNVGVCLPANGASMFPAIPGGSVIRVEPVKVEDLRRGDVILYRVGDRMIAHRLVGKVQVHGRIRLITRGDAFPGTALEEVEPSQVLGRVAAIRWGRWQMRIDAGLGRFGGRLAARISAAISWSYPALRRLRARLRRAPGPGQPH
ncbi:MAG: S24 family peptidase [Desulfobaccales bacterium]